MDATPEHNHELEISLLRARLQSLRSSVDEMDHLLSRYVDSQNALRESEERFRLMVEGARDYAIFMLDPQGHIISWNTGAQLIKGYTQAEIFGHHFSIFYPPEDVAAGKPAWELQIAATEGKYEEEGWRVRKDGSLFWANVLITALFDAKGALRGFGKVTRDMTDRRQAEMQREQLRERERQLTIEQERHAHMETMVRLRDEFLTVAAHELRTPLTSLLGNIQLIHRRAQQEGILSERDQRNLRVVIDQASRLNRMVLTLLDLSRLQMGDLSITRTSFDLVALVRQLLEATRPSLNHHTLTYSGPSAPLLIEGDPLRLEQVLHNLVQNAVKYSLAGGPVQVQVAQRDTKVSLAVTDQGIGIPQAAQPQLFQRFYRASNASELNISGLGIGLYVVKGIVTLHGGSIDVVSEEGRGSTFTVWLPLPDPPAADARASQSTAPSPGETV